MRLKYLAILVTLLVSVNVTLGQSQCGLVFNSPNARIIGGSVANVNTDLFILLLIKLFILKNKFITF